MYKQQIQTKKFFELDAKNWSKKAHFKKIKLFNTTHERNLYVLDKLKFYKSKSFLDVGCGSGDLVFEASKIVKKCIGIDFSSQMIKFAKKNYKNNKLKFINEDFFNYSLKEKFDLISANGFIEYLSLNDIVKFLKISNKTLNKNGYLIFGTRNRLYNLYSLNKFSLNELKKKSFNKFYEESICLGNLSFNKFLKLKKNKFSEVLFKQPKTGINVDKRHQFSPLQLVDILSKNKFRVLEFHPINYHVVPPIKNNLKIFKHLSNSIFFLKDINKLAYIPFSSSFMVIAKKIN